MKKQPLQPGSPEKPQGQSGQPSRKGRSVLLGSGAVAAAVLAVMLTTKQKDVPEETREKAPAPVTKELPLQPSLPSKLQSPEIPVDPSIPVPICEITADSSPSKMPKNLRMTQDEFIILSDRITSVMTINIKEGLVPYIREHPQELQDVLRQTIQQAAGVIEMADPRAQEEMMSFNEVWSRNPDPVKLVAHINEYLEPSGWYFDFRVTENGELYLEYFPVQQRKKVVIKDSLVSHEIPVRYLGEPVINHPSYASETAPVSASADLASVNALTGHLNERKEYIEDMLVSAATSIFLSRKFPKAATLLDRGKRFHVPINVKAGDGNIASLEGFYPPIMFHMIAGTGLQLANSRRRSAPDLHALYLQDPKALAREQGLMAKMLPIATLQAAPDSPAKQELIQIFQSQGTINFEKLKALMFTPPYTMEHSRKAGEILYRAGYTAFEAMEKGKFTEVGQ